MNHLSFKESVAASTFQNIATPEIVEDIVNRYNMSTPEGIERALAHAAWVGYCHGKGWVEGDKE